ncbi:MAG: hypothetical protein CBC57_07130 [Euryarchaeota archaeon TMED97]|nr:MAG: hypothetical protein CBC57_07130 [Euryarchaeota archaeon TMED97]
MSTLKVDGIRSNSATSDAITLADNGTCTANITNKPNRNLIINGAMQVAQRGSASSSTQGLATVDRFKKIGSGLGNTFSQEQITLSSSDTPYSSGFRKAFRVSQDQAGTANAAGAIDFSHYIEAQNLACSGWNYTSASSKITLQFWFRASTNQTFYAILYTPDGTVQTYPFAFTASGNNAWTKITHTIVGNSNITINNDNGTGLIIYLIPFYGTNYTNNRTLNTWNALDSTNYCPDMASTWLTAGASTFDVTGMQLEVGSVATDFEHRSFHEERELCRRYYHAILGKMGSWGSAVAYNTGSAQGWMTFHPEMRAAPTFTWTGTLKLEDGAYGTTTSNTTAATTMGSHGFSWWTGGFSNLVDNNVYYVYESNQSGYFQFDAEL